MQWVWRIIGGIAGLFLLLVVISVVTLKQGGAAHAPPDVLEKLDGMSYLSTAWNGTVPPSAKIIAQDGTRGDLSFFHGKVTLVYLWSPERTISSIVEFADFAKLRASVPDPNVAMIAIAVGSGGWGPVQDFARRHPITLPNFIVAPGPEGSLFQYYTLPTTLFLAPDGTEIIRLNGLPGMWDSPRVVQLLQVIMAKYLPDQGKASPTTPVATVTPSRPSGMMDQITGTGSIR